MIHFTLGRLKQSIDTEVKNVRHVFTATDKKQAQSLIQCVENKTFNFIWRVSVHFSKWGSGFFLLSFFRIIEHYLTCETDIIPSWTDVKTNVGPSDFKTFNPKQNL